jgi:hypothetical protein
VDVARQVRDRHPHPHAALAGEAQQNPPRRVAIIGLEPFIGTFGEARDRAEHPAGALVGGERQPAAVAPLPELEQRGRQQREGPGRVLDVIEQRVDDALQVRRVLSAVALLAIAAAARADTVTEWNLNAANALFNLAGQPPQVSVPHLAMVHGAVYDAVNAIDDGYEGYLISPRAARASASEEAAAATAAHDVLAHLLPGQAKALDDQYMISLAAVPDGPAETEGIAVGRLAAAIPLSRLTVALRAPMRRTRQPVPAPTVIENDAPRAAIPVRRAER